MDFQGIYRGVVTNTADPEGLGRLKVQVPQVLGAIQTEWAWPVSPNLAGITPLDIGDPVWVAFEGGDLDHPIWLGTWALPSQSLNSLPALDDTNVLHWMTRVTS